MEELAVLHELNGRLNKIIEQLNNDKYVLSKSLGGDLFDSYKVSLEKDIELMEEERRKLKKLLEEIGI